MEVRDTIIAILEQAHRQAADFANVTEGNFKPTDIDAIYEDAYMAIYQAGMEECAETHFKPGWELTARDVKEAVEEARKAGIMDVLRFMVTTPMTEEVLLYDKRWQAQLEEWGVSNEDPYSDPKEGGQTSLPSV